MATLIMNANKNLETYIPESGDFFKREYDNRLFYRIPAVDSTTISNLATIVGFNIVGNKIQVWTDRHISEKGISGFTKAKKFHGKVQIIWDEQ